MEQFRFLTHDFRSPAFNLASEEYLLKKKGGYWFYLWRNDPSVIIGVNQDALKEVNLSFCESNGIKVIRRLTGGGAVYHDPGNVCYTVIAPYDENENNYLKFTAPVIEYLSSLGLDAEFSGRNDITVGGKKISGNAQTVYKDRIMHHGTLLFSTDMSVLSSALVPSRLKVESKGIDSVRKRVTNIRDELKKKITVEEFLDGLRKNFAAKFPSYSFDEEDIGKINALVAEKYSLDSWNLGMSPKGKTRFEKKFAFGIFEISFDTVGGAISGAAITGDFFTKKDIAPFCASLGGVKLDLKSVSKAFENIGDYIVGADGKEIAEAMFS